MPSITFKLFEVQPPPGLWPIYANQFQASFGLQLAAVAARALYGDVVGAILDCMLLYIGVRAMQERSSILFWFYLIPCAFGGLAMLAAWARLQRSKTAAPPARPTAGIEQNPLDLLPGWLLLSTAMIDFASAALAAKISSKIYQSNFITIDYMRPDALGRLVYTRGETVADLTQNAQTEHVKYAATQLSSSGGEEEEEQRDDSPRSVEAV